MSVETLRKAASLMRERAEKASPGPWAASPPHGWTDYDENLVYCPERFPGDNREVTPGGGEHGDGGLLVPDAAHIASWHPAVALAVAAWLDQEADLVDLFADQYRRKPTAENAAMCAVSAGALNAAIAYLREQP